MKQELSKDLLSGVTVGFIYWLQEYHDMRGLKDLRINMFHSKLRSLQEEYNSKYPEGLTGWASEEPDASRSMKSFDDLSFAPATWMGPSPMYRAYLKFDNGRAISVITEGSFIKELDEENLTFPDVDPWYGEYEVGFLKEDGSLSHVFIGGEVHLVENKNGNSVARHCRVRDVIDIMEAIQKL